ncbi:MAG TPA: LUD domain-containing protein, partial [Solirubrobacteraceae bacterium]|nr:LUD domain-containing protein [Solirubrobacteraceae bacterium]
RACARWRLRHLVVAPALPEAWRPRGVALVDDTGLTASDLDDIDGALTGCALAIAETGTIVLDGQGSSGRRAITLIPDHHICVIEAAQVTGSVPEAVAALAEAVTRRRAPITMVSGPSASSDIELTRIEGVHGPRHLLALVVDGR